MKHSFLRQINACVHWRGIRTLLNKKYTKTQNAVGNPACDALLMFKILLLEETIAQWLHKPYPHCSIYTFFYSSV
nr:hypothetical protein [Porphyromonas sp. COT-290 OH860]